MAVATFAPAPVAVVTMPHTPRHARIEPPIITVAPRYTFGQPIPPTAPATQARHIDMQLLTFRFGMSVIAIAIGYMAYAYLCLLPTAQTTEQRILIGAEYFVVLDLCLAYVTAAIFVGSPRR